MGFTTIGIPGWGTAGTVFTRPARPLFWKLPTTSFTDTGAGLGDHSYVVRAVESNGIESLDSNRVTVPTLPEKAVVQYGAQSYVFVATDSGPAAGRATYRLVPVTRGVSEDGYTEFHLPATEQGKPLRFVVEGAYALLGKLKNAEEED